MVAADVVGYNSIAARVSVVMILFKNVPKGIRTPVTAVKGRCPRPLDDGDRTLWS